MDVCGRDRRHGRAGAVHRRGRVAVHVHVAVAAGRVIRGGAVVPVAVVGHVARWRRKPVGKVDLLVFPQPLAVASPLVLARVAAVVGLGIGQWQLAHAHRGRRRSLGRGRKLLRRAVLVHGRGQVLVLVRVRVRMRVLVVVVAAAAGRVRAVARRGSAPVHARVAAGRADGSTGRTIHGNRSRAAAAVGAQWLTKSAVQRCARRDAALDGRDGHKGGRGGGRDGLEDAVVARLLTVGALAVRRVLVATAADLFPVSDEARRSHKNKDLRTFRLRQYLQAIEVLWRGADSGGWGW